LHLATRTCKETVLIYKTAREYVSVERRARERRREEERKSGRGGGGGGRFIDKQRMNVEEEEEEEGLFKADAVNEEDPERDRATQV